MLEKIQETATFLREKMHTSPETAIILGTGLGSLVHEITDKYEISYKDIPNFPVSTVEGHSGKLIFGKLGNKDIMAMQGRFHFYEGYSMKEVTSGSFMKRFFISSISLAVKSWWSLKASDSMCSLYGDKS